MRRNLARSGDIRIVAEVGSRRNAITGERTRKGKSNSKSVEYPLTEMKAVPPKAIDGAKDYVKMNRLHWNALADRWWKERASLLQQVKNDSAYIEQMEPKMAPYLRKIRGKKVIVLQFGDGFVMLACAKKGALVTGIDLSSEQVRRAEKAANECGVDVKPMEADCQNLPDSIRSSNFDLAVAECGIFIWIENLDAWMRNAHRVLKKGGRLIVSDFHPFSICTQWKEGETVTFTRSYFDQQPRVQQEEGLPPQ